MIANYAAVTEADYTALKLTGNDNFVDDCEELFEEAQDLLDLDKNWDILHFLLTGSDCSEPDAGNPLSEAITGQITLDEDDYTAVINPERVANIAKALSDFDMDKALATFTLEQGAEAELYPNIWDGDEDLEELKEILAEDFERLVEFYNQSADAGLYVMVSIW
ncbi:YfbM family protein [Gleimia coleocanis]|nr:YfbM family protein [Gleimia coleocanis]